MIPSIKKVPKSIWAKQGQIPIMSCNLLICKITWSLRSHQALKLCEFISKLGSEEIQPLSLMSRLNHPVFFCLFLSPEDLTFTNVYWYAICYLQQQKVNIIKVFSCSVVFQFIETQKQRATFGTPNEIKPIKWQQSKTYIYTN